MKQEPDLLIDAAGDGDVDGLNQLVIDGYNINYADSSGCTALMAAGRNAHLNCVTYLINAGAHLNNVDTQGRTAMMRAASAILPSSYNCIEALVEAGADINIVNNSGQTVLISTIKLIGMSNQNIEPRLKTALFLLKKDARVDQIDNGGYTAINWAGYTKIKNLVEQLLLKGADINFQDRTGVSPLMVSTIGNDIDVVRLLLTAGADQSLVNQSGVTAMDMARNAGNLKMIAIYEEYFLNRLINQNTNQECELEFAF